MVESLPAALDALISDTLAVQVIAPENWGRPDAAAVYADSVLLPMFRVLDPSATVRLDQGLDAALAASTGLVAVSGCGSRCSHLVRGRFEGMPYQFSWFTSELRQPTRKATYFSGLLAQGLFSKPLAGRTVIIPADKEILAEPVNRGVYPIDLAVTGVRGWSTQASEARRLVTQDVADAIGRMALPITGSKATQISVGFVGDRMSIAWGIGEIFGPQAWRANEAAEGLRQIASRVATVLRLLRSGVATPIASTEDLDVLFGHRAVRPDEDTDRTRVKTSIHERRGWMRFLPKWLERPGS